MNKPHVTFWVIAVIALLWNLMGVFAFYSDMTISPEALSEMTPELKSYYENNPMWNKIAYGAAVISGALGSIGLLMRKAWAVPLFIISLVAVLINNIYTFLFSGATETMTGSQAALSGMITLIALFLWYYSKKSHGKGWIA